MSVEATSLGLSTGVAATPRWPTAGGPGLSESQRAFAAVLGQAERDERGRASLDQPPQRDKAARRSPDDARKVAQQLVSVALVQPLLAQLRGSNSAAPPFAPTQGEKQFQGIIDAQIAERITSASNFAVVDRMVEQMLRTSAAAPTAATDKDPHHEEAAATAATAAAAIDSGGPAARGGGGTGWRAPRAGDGV